jgi:hypothetical protein
LGFKITATITAAKMAKTMSQFVLMGGMGHLWDEAQNSFIVALLRQPRQQS